MIITQKLDKNSNRNEVSLFSLIDVSKVFETNNITYCALKNVNLEISEGEFVCLLGPSGCGKSTLLNMLAGFEVVSSGTIEFEKRTITSSSQDRMVFFQDASAALLPWLSVEENIHFGLKVRKISKELWPSITNRYLSMVELNEHRHKFPAQLSGGMRQRLQIARGLAVEPKVLLMDEPFAALDSLTRKKMHQFLLEIRQATKKTIVFVTHDISESIHLADRICLMSVGPESHITEVITINETFPRDLSDPKIAKIFKYIESTVLNEFREEF
jgi:NitT/TauT family transport system ATP-binding protein